MEKPSILIVDDVPNSRGLLRRILSVLDCTQIQEVSSGDRAVEIYKKTYPDLVFLDIEMPGKDGLETLQELIRFDPKAYVVMLSASSTFENIKKTLALGAKGFVVKPYNTDKVRAVVSAFERGSGKAPDCPAP